jgi:hypothetical protein
MWLYGVFIVPHRGAKEKRAVNKEQKQAEKYRKTV